MQLKANIIANGTFVVVVVVVYFIIAIGEVQGYRSFD